jgi:nucleoside 2-deoxyribosyltransferase
MPKPKVYVAGPLGFSEVGRYFYYSELLPLIEEVGFEVIDPWVLTSKKLIDAAAAKPYGPKQRQAWRGLNPVIAANNTEGIQRADLLVAVLDGTDVDSGTAAEIGYAAALGKPTIGYRGDFRQAGDNEGSIVNLQVEFFITESGGSIVGDLKSLKKKLKAIRSRFTEK